MFKLSAWWGALSMETTRERKDLEGKITVFGQVKGRSLLDADFTSNY